MNMADNILYRNESYNIIGAAMEVRKTKLIYERIPCTVKWKAHEQ